MDFLALRLGAPIKIVQNEKLDGFSELGGGVGFRLHNYRLDYAFVPFANLGNTHRISFTGKF